RRPPTPARFPYTTLFRSHRVLIVLRGFHQRALQLTVGRQQLANGVFTPQLQVSRNLVVTATAGVQFFTQLTDFIDEFAFHPTVKDRKSTRLNSSHVKISY